MDKSGSLAQRRGQLGSWHVASVARHSQGYGFYLLDNEGATVLPCHCLESSDQGLWLEAPPGYGLAEGQEYELWPIGNNSSAPDWIGRAWIRIEQIEYAADEAGHLLIKAIRLPLEAVARSTS